MKRIQLEDEDQVETDVQIAVLANLDHPNIIKYYGSFIDDGLICIVSASPLSLSLSSLSMPEMEICTSNSQGEGR